MSEDWDDYWTCDEMSEDWDDDYWTCDGCKNDVAQCVCHSGRMSEHDYKRLTSRQEKDKEQDDES